MFKNALIASSAIAAIMGITAPSFAENADQENFNNYQHNRDVRQDYRNFHQDTRDVRDDEWNDRYVNFRGRYDAEGRNCVYFDRNHVRQIRQSCLYGRNGDSVYYRDSSGGTYWRNGDQVSRRTPSGDTYQRNGDSVYYRDSSGGTYTRNGNSVYERDPSGATYYHSFR